MILLAHAARLLSAYAVAQILTGVQLGSLMALLVLAGRTTLEQSAAVLPIGLVLVAVQTRWLERTFRRGRQVDVV